jgi:hypothetical protein
MQMHGPYGGSEIVRAVRTASPKCARELRVREQCRRHKQGDNEQFEVYSRRVSQERHDRGETVHEEDDVT